MTERSSGFGSPLLALASVSLISSLAAAAPRVPTHVACVGDSITYGSGASNQATKSYPANLQTLFGASVQVKNFGHNGATLLSAPFGDVPYEEQAAYTAAGSFVSGAGANAVVDVIIMLGANDSKNFNWAPSGKPKNDQQFLKDYRALVEHFGSLTPKPQVFLALPLATGNNPCCSIDGRVIHDEILPLIKQLATEKNLPTIDLNTPTTGHPEYFGDGVHPTDAGYVIVAGLMRDGLLASEQSSGGAGSGVGGTAASAGSAGIGAAGSGGTSGFASTDGAGSPNAGGGSAGAAGA
ncbi:MAG TPA: GDSL-type esterase/lipase family protein, partial [Polyangiaceae bacterium]|nr:GDSL-type esterase/lipase family protein [Polyangiaceae bacterium]